MIQELFKKFFNTKQEPLIFKAPGRVNLIGEHTDYNGGFVLPMAINLATTLALTLRDDERVRVYSANLNSFAEFSLQQDLSSDPAQKHWFYYIAGVLKLLIAQGFILRGADVYIESAVPLGAGLSSSASLEIVTGYAFLTALGYSVDLMMLAQLCQRAEHLYAGTKCGIMDQYICAMATREHALLIDCQNLHAVEIPLKMPDTAFLICDSGVHHNLAHSEYNIRRTQCETAAALLGKNVLREVQQTDLHDAKLDEQVLKRVRHVLSENERVWAATQAMQRADWPLLGELMQVSHRSLQYDYEVSCPELNFLVDSALTIPGVYGSRMTGGGFGGCTVSLIEKASLDTVTHQLKELYLQQFGLPLSVYHSHPAKGVEQLL